MKRGLLLVILAALASMAPDACPVNECKRLTAIAESTCSAGPSAACDRALAAAQQACPAPTPPPTPPPTTTTTTLTPEPEPTPEPTPTPTPTPGRCTLACPPTVDGDKCGKWATHSEEFQKSMNAAMTLEPVTIWTSDMSLTEKIEAEAEQRRRVLARVTANAGTPCAGLYGEEVALFGREESENFDIISGSGKSLKPPQYKSTCAPAAMSSCYVAAPTPTPEPTPPPSSGECPFSAAAFATAGRWQSLTITQGAGSRINADATAVVCSSKCAPRACCPSSVADPSAPADCDARMTQPTWSIASSVSGFAERPARVSSGAFCAAGGPDGLATNALRNCMTGHGKIKVCSWGRCIEASF